MSKPILQLGVVLLCFFAFIYLFVYFSPDQNSPQADRDFRIPRAPAEAKAVSNPIPDTPEAIVLGNQLYHGKGTCFACHGNEGRGDGPAGTDLHPQPRDFTNAEFQTLRTDGELFWVIRNGSPGSRMFSYAPSVITEEEAWTVIRYLRTLSVRENTG